jgi:uncharacterized caspase-like protein
MSRDVSPSSSASAAIKPSPNYPRRCATPRPWATSSSRSRASTRSASSSTPTPAKLAEASEYLFADKETDDLLLFYFSGHGVKDERGQLHLAVPRTRKHASGELVRATAVSCRHVHDIMSASRSRRQVVILDCCFSGAFADGLQPKDGGHVDLRSQLGGEGRAVLTSSASTQFSFDASESGLSTYTQYIVNGIATGEADLNHDGQITIDELHEYARPASRSADPP